ncbi:MAG: hypothetical protein P1V51_09875 [Deltaproteobacteria bacterium]|nr:hypothetical protein [Deltaproteobacteria bacterium]
MRRLFLVLPLCGLVTLALSLPAGGSAAAPPTPVPAAGEESGASLTRGIRSPEAVVASADGDRAWVIDAGAELVHELDLQRGEVRRRIPVEGRPVAAVLSPGEEHLWVTLQHGAAVARIDLAAGEVGASLPVSPEPRGLALSLDGQRLFVTGGLEDRVSALALPAGRLLWQARVGRGPSALALTPDGARLVVANGLGRSVTLLSAATGEVLEHRPLGVASLLRGVALTPDGRHAIVTHVLSRDRVTTLQMERGWIHSNGFSILDLDQPGHRVTLLLDTLLEGATNPNGVVVLPDASAFAVALAGIHQVALVDLPRVLALAEATAPEAVERRAQDVELLRRQGIARRLPAGGEGPRGLALRPGHDELLVATYFGDGLSVLDARTGELKRRVPLGSPQELAPAVALWREGERLFNDGRLGFQTWYSCVSCHEEDAGMDGLNWDLPNDGTGNFKNAKSLRNVHDTAPAMWRGVRADMDAATRAGQRFEGFLPEEEKHAALIAFLSDPPRPPNPYRDGRLAIARGRLVFQRALCDTCHPEGTFTDQRPHDLGLRGPDDLHARFDTPSLRECYRSAPYLHGGTAPTLESIFREHDPRGLHGRTKDLSEAELSDLVAYLKSL